ncbi:MAG: hypothetical protein IKE85_01770 [Mogibacterium sp.]|nr:hypothetical protein [Mogibacterium sp.]
MKEINSIQAFKLTSPNPLVLVCTEKEDGSTNIAPVSLMDLSLHSSHGMAIP